MKRFLSILALGLAFALPATARELPDDIEVAYMKSAQYPTVQFSSGGFSWVKLMTLGIADSAKNFQMSPGVKVRNQKNVFVTRSKISMYGGNFVAFKRNGKDQIQEIWVLNADEVEKFRQQAATH